MAAYALARFTSPNAGVSVNQAVTDQYIAAAYGLALKNLDVNAVGIAIANTFTSAGTLDLSAASDTAGLKLPSKAGAAPTADGFLAFDTTTHAPWAGFNGTSRQLASLTGTETFTNKTLTSPVINVTSDATGDIYYRSAGGLFTRLAVGTASQVLVGGTVPAWGAVALTTIGPTFATSTTTMTNSGTWYTGATLASALVNGASYLLTGQIMIGGTANDIISARLYDSTNSVEIGSLTGIAPNVGSNRTTFTFCIPYSGFAGTPTIVIQANDNTTGASTILITATNGAANKATFISAIRTA